MSKNPSKSVVIFDFDGTLVDSMGSFADLAADLMVRHYRVSWEQARESYLNTSGLPFFEQVELLFPGSHDNRQVAQEFELHKKKNYLSTPLFAEVPEALSQLKERGCRVVVSSNNGQEIVDEYLDHCSALSLSFDMVLGYRQGFSKGKDHFYHVLKSFSLSPESALFVGDSLQDAQKALSFGVDFVGRLGTFTRSHFQEAYPAVPVVHDLRELQEVVCR